MIANKGYVVGIGKSWGNIGLTFENEIGKLPDSKYDPDFEDNSGVTPDRKGTPKKQTPGSNAFVPSVAGMIIAAEVVKDLTQFHVTDLFKDE